jgi:hypothetical protein
MEQRWHLDQFWTEDGPYSAVADINSIPTEPSYWTSGFLSIQFAIENSFLDVSFLKANFTYHQCLVHRKKHQRPGRFATYACAAVSKQRNACVLETSTLDVEFDGLGHNYAHAAEHFE